MVERVNIIGVPISDVNFDTALSSIKNNLDKAKQSYICISNVHTTVMAHEDKGYKKIIEESFLTLPDGKPLSVVGVKKGHAQMGQVRGVDLMQTLFSEDNGYTHYFYGNTAENLASLIHSLKNDYPFLKIAGYEPSVFRPLSPQEMQDLSQRIKQTQADFLWVGLGAPRQEVFCSQIKGQTGAVPIGVGGAFNVLAHIVPDAPEFFKKNSLEWLYRLIKEPRRLFKRYLTTNMKFIYLLIKGE